MTNKDNHPPRRLGGCHPSPIFDFIQKLGPIEEKEMYRVFNMGIGYVLIVSPSFTRSIMAHLRKLGETPYFIGKVKRGSGKVVIK